MTDPGFSTQPSTGAPGELLPRFLARLIDGILLSIVTGLVFWVVLGLRGVAYLVISGLITYAYFVIMDMQTGSTLGKKIMGLSVRNAAGQKPTLEEAAIRESFNILNAIPAIGWLLVLIAYIVIAITIHGSVTKQGIHDQKAKGTQVVGAAKI